MKVLVIGAGGFLGGHFTKWLVERGHDVTAISRRPLAEWYQVSPEACSLGSRTAYAQFHLAWTHGERYDRVYHFAADVGGMPYQTKNRFPSVAALQTDLEVLQECVREGTELFFTSSVCVYGDQKFCVEHGPLKPTPGYGEAKLFMERAIEYAVEERNLRAMVIRLDNTFGPNGDFFSDRAKAPMALAGRAATKPELEVFGGEETSRGFMHVRQVIEAVDLLDKKGKWDGQPVNISCGQQTTLGRLARIAAPGKKLVFHEADTIGSDRRVVSIDRFRKITGSDVLDRFDVEGYEQTCRYAREISQ